MTTLTTSTLASISDQLSDLAISDEVHLELSNTQADPRPGTLFLFSFKWILRLTCLSIIFIAPWANYQLIKLFQTRPFHKRSSAKWYIIFKAVFDTLYMLISTPIIFSLTFNIDIIHRNMFTCKLLTYMHYLADDLISIMLTLLCLDRMLRITCGCRLRSRLSLGMCIGTTVFFVLANMHHIVRLQHQDGFCQKIQITIMNNDFDIYYSYIYTSVTWTIIFIASLNLGVSVYCDRVRRRDVKQRQNISLARNGPRDSNSIGSDADHLGLIHHTDDWEDPTVVTIEPLANNEKAHEQEQQDDIDIQLTVCVLITATIFLACNLPNFIIFVMRFVYNSVFSSIGYMFVYISLFPLLIAHTVSYFIFNHLAARLFPAHS